VGALAGALGGGIGASLSEGDFGDVMLGAGIGAVFGAICPHGAIGGLIVGGGAALTAYALGGDQDMIATAYHAGSLVGGLLGDFTGVVRNASKTMAMRPAVYKGLAHVGPDLLGAGVGAITGGIVGGTSASALHGANLGMMGGGIVGGAARGLWGVRRATNAPIGTVNSLWKNRPPGIQLRKIGNYWVKRVDPNANPLMQVWARETIRAGPVLNFVSYARLRPSR
jgi:hypothetical protein